MFSSESYRLPAEWEPQSAVQLTWPHSQTDWAPMLDDICDTYREMRRIIERYEPVIVVGAPDGEPAEATFRCPTNDTWARDHAFLTLVPTAKRMGDSSAETRAPLLLDFRFNGWGEKFAADLDNAINRRLYEAGVVRGEYVDCLDFVLEGGSIESDGRGTIFTTTPCLLAPHRNQPLTKEQIEAELKRRLCARRIVWIDHGQLVGDDTDGHIDTLVRIAPDDTLLYVGCDDTEDEQYEELRLMEEELRQLRTLEGRPYRLLKLPMPRPIYERGERREITCNLCKLPHRQRCRVGAHVCTTRPRRRGVPHHRRGVPRARHRRTGLPHHHPTAWLPALLHDAVPERVLKN